MLVWGPSEWKELERSNRDYCFEQVDCDHAFYSEKADWYIVITGSSKAGVCIIQSEESVESFDDAEGQIQRMEAWTIFEQTSDNYRKALERFTRLHATEKTSRSHLTAKIDPKDCARGC